MHRISEILSFSFGTFSGTKRPRSCDRQRSFYRRYPDAPAPLADPLVASLAKKYSKTPAQILLRFLIQRGISVIPKSSNPERIKENIDTFDFNISPDDMQSLKALDLGYRRFKVENLRHHKFYPFSSDF